MDGFPRFGLWWLCACLVVSSGCVSHRTSPRTARLLDDKVITERVEVALQRSSRVFSKVQVQVDTVGGVVTLRGSVPNLQTKEKASQVAEGVQKVREVDNEIQVR